MATQLAEDKSVLGLDNPMGTDGFEFVEYTAPDTNLLRDLFTKMGFPAIAKHKRKDVTLHRQGEINFIINAESGSYAEQYAGEHGPSACAMAFRVKDAKAAFERAVRLGATPVNNDVAHGEMDIPAIEGIGGSRLFFVDRYGDTGSIYEVDFDFFADADQKLTELDSRLTYIDHLTHNVHRGRMSVWADFYEKLFNFREIRYFDIEGKQTGLFSKAMTSPCGKIRIPLNESQDDKSQIEEFLREYKGEGIQHIALGTSDIYQAVDIIRERGIPFQDIERRCDRYRRRPGRRLQDGEPQPPELYRALSRRDHRRRRHSARRVHDGRAPHCLPQCALVWRAGTPQDAASGVGRGRRRRRLWQFVRRADGRRAGAFPHPL